MRPDFEQDLRHKDENKMILNHGVLLRVRPGESVSLFRNLHILLYQLLFNRRWLVKIDR